jgi:hypothetical protein
LTSQDKNQKEPDVAECNKPLFEGLGYLAGAIEAEIDSRESALAWTMTEMYQAKKENREPDRKKGALITPSPYLNPTKPPVLEWRYHILTYERDWEKQEKYLRHLITQIAEFGRSLIIKPEEKEEGILYSPESQEETMIYYIHRAMKWVWTYLLNSSRTGYLNQS